MDGRGFFFSAAIQPIFNCGDAMNSLLQKRLAALKDRPSRHT